MNLLKPIVKVVHDLLQEHNIDEIIDLRISNSDGYDYQINNLVKHQKHPNIEKIKNEITISLNDSGLIEKFDFANNLFINLKINAESILENLINVE